MINEHNLFYAEVRNINDPFKSGRVQIRIYGNHDDEANIKDADLPWAIVTQPITSAATSKIGIIPTGMVVGSRVFGVFLDHAQQYPLILGTYSRGSKLLNDSMNDGGQEILDPNSKGIDTPNAGHPEDNNNRGLTPNVVKVGGTAVNAFSAAYNEAPYVLNGIGPSGLTQARNMFAPNANEKTIAAVNPQTDLPAALAQVGTSGEIMPSMVSLLSIVRSLMTMSNQVNSNNGNNTGTDQYVISAFTSALSIMANKYGFWFVVKVLVNAFSQGAYSELNPDFDGIVTTSIVNFIQNGITSNFTNLPFTAIPGSNLLPQPGMSPSPIVSSPPEYYIQQYYSITSDPYPGYVQWESATGGEYAYTVRANTQPNYASSEAAIEGGAQIQLVIYLDPFFAANFLTVGDINYVLEIVVPETVTTAQTNALGSGSSSNMLGLASLLLGLIGTMINNSQSNHLPNSVLNQSSMTNTLQKFASNMNILQMMKNKSMVAFALPSALSSLGSLLSSVTGGITVSLGQNGGISASSLIAMVNSGMAQSVVTSLNTLAINNQNLGVNTISTIASVASALSNAKVSASNIIAIQTLLAEIAEE